MAEKRKIKFDWGTAETPRPAEVEATIVKMKGAYDPEPKIRIAAALSDLPYEMLVELIEIAESHEVRVHVKVEATYTSTQQLSFWDPETEWQIPPGQARAAA